LAPSHGLCHLFFTRRLKAAGGPFPPRKFVLVLISFSNPATLYLPQTYLFSFFSRQAGSLPSIPLPTPEMGRDLPAVKGFAPAVACGKVSCRIQNGLAAHKHTNGRLLATSRAFAVARSAFLPVNGAFCLCRFLSGQRPNCPVVQASGQGRRSPRQTGDDILSPKHEICCHAHTACSRDEADSLCTAPA
jgi:hypothetical protein